MRESNEYVKALWLLLGGAAAIIGFFLLMLLVGCVTVNKYYPVKKDTVVIWQMDYQRQLLPYNNPFYMIEEMPYYPITSGDTLLFKTLPLIIDSLPRVCIDSTGKLHKIKLGNELKNNTTIEGGYKINLSYTPDTLILK